MNGQFKSITVEVLLMLNCVAHDQLYFLSQLLVSQKAVGGSPFISRSYFYKIA